MVRKLFSPDADLQMPWQDSPASRLDAVCEGRLTTVSGDPVPTTDQTGVTTLRFTLDRGNKLALYDGARLRTYTFTELSLALGTVVNGQAYDVFAYPSGSTPTLEKLAWANATVTMTIASPCVVTWTAHGLVTGQTVVFTTSGALPTGVSANVPYVITRIDANSFRLSTGWYNAAIGTYLNSSGSQSGTHTGHHPHGRQTGLVRQGGMWCKSGDTTRRYLGSFFATSTSAMEDSEAIRGLWNLYNQRARTLKKTYSVDSWPNGSTTWRVSNQDDAWRVQAMVGLVEDNVTINMWALSATNGQAGIGHNNGSTPTPYMGFGQATNVTKAAQFMGYPTLGLNNWLAMEAGSATFYGDVGDPTQFGPAVLQGTIKC